MKNTYIGSMSSGLLSLELVF